jgi:hypothetical protein
MLLVIATKYIMETNAIYVRARCRWQYLGLNRRYIYKRQIGNLKIINRKEYVPVNIHK